MEKSKKWNFSKDSFDKRLIELVKDNKSLYDKSYSGYTDRETRKNIWRQIASILNHEDTECQKRWMILRERYARELRKSMKGTDVYYRWIHFDRMSFLKHHIVSKNSSSRAPTHHELDYNIIEYDYKAIDNAESIKFANEVQQYNQVTNKSDESYKQKHRITHDDKDDIVNEEMFDEVYPHMKKIIKDVNQTIISYTNVVKDRLNNSEYDNFGILVSETLLQLSFVTRIKAKAHILQYLAKLHLNQTAFG